MRNGCFFFRFCRLPFECFALCSFSFFFFARKKRANVRLKVVEDQAAAFVPKEQLASGLVHLQPVDLGIMFNGSRGLARDEVENADCFEINHVRQLLLRLFVPGAPGADTDAQQVRIHVLRADGTKKVVHAKFNDRELAGMKDEATGWVLKEELLRARDCEEEGDGEALGRLAVCASLGAFFKSFAYLQRQETSLQRPEDMSPSRRVSAVLATIKLSFPSTFT